MSSDPLELLNLSVQALQQQRAQIGQLSLEQQAMRQRLDSLPINGAQKWQVQKAVRELARLLGGKPHNYRKAWGEFYDRFGLVAYRDLPANRFDEAISFLRKLVEAYQVSDGLGMTLE